MRPVGPRGERAVVAAASRRTGRARSTPNGAWRRRHRPARPIVGNAPRSCARSPIARAGSQGDHQRGGDDGGGLDPQHVRRRARRGRRPPPARPGSSRPRARSRPSCRPGRSGRPPGSATAAAGSTSAAGTGPTSSGSHTRRDCIAASAATRRSRSSGAGRAFVVPAHDRALGRQQHDPVDADLGALLHQPARAGRPSAAPRRPSTAATAPATDVDRRRRPPAPPAASGTAATGRRRR